MRKQKFWAVERQSKLATDWASSYPALFHYKRVAIQRHKQLTELTSDLKMRVVRVSIQWEKR